MKTRYAGPGLLKAETTKSLLEEFKTSFMKYFKSGAKGDLNEKLKIQFERDLLRMVTKPTGPSMLTLVEQKGLVDKFQTKCYTNPKFTIIPGDAQVFVVINDSDEHLSDYFKTTARINIGTICFCYDLRLKLCLSCFLFLLQR